MENPCLPSTEIGGIPLIVASYKGEKPHTFRPDGFVTIKTLESGKSEKFHFCMN